MHRHLRVGLVACWLVACADETSLPPLQDRTSKPPVDETFLCPVTPAQPGETVVLVHDRGFDLGNQVFQGKIGGCYSIRCRPSTGLPAGTLEQQKKALIDSLSTRDDDCRLEPGVTLTRSANFERIEAGRGDWNEAINADRTPPDPSGLIATTVDGNGGFNYHGTAVASLLAAPGASVRLVLVSDSSIASASEEPSCPSPASLERQVELLEDPDVQAAYIAAPSTALTDDFLAVFRSHGVSIQNESFGALPGAVIETLCPGPWRRLYELLGSLEASRNEALAKDGLFDGVSLLTLRAAGNESQQIDEPGDSLDCTPPGAVDPWGPGSRTLRIGALSPSWSTAVFSNRGGCVDLFAPGERIIVGAPQDFLTVQSGTSFAAPLVARLAASLAPGSAEQRVADLRALAPQGKDLAKEHFSTDFFYRHGASAMQLQPSPGLYLPRLRAFRWPLSARRNTLLP